MVFFKPGFVAPLMLFHHVMAIAAFAYSLLHPVQWTIALVLATELSTPFVNLRTIIGSLVGKSSLLYKVNGIIILVSFFLARMLHGGVYLWYGLFADWSELQAAIPLTAMTTLYVVGLAITTMNVYWFAKILLGAIKVLEADRVEGGKSKTD